MIIILQQVQIQSNDRHSLRNPITLATAHAQYTFVMEGFGPAIHPSCQGSKAQGRSFSLALQWNLYIIYSSQLAFLHLLPIVPPLLSSQAARALLACCFSKFSSYLSFHIFYYAAPTCPSCALATHNLYCTYRVEHFRTQSMVFDYVLLF